jgi:hypothetical protein
MGVLGGVINPENVNNFESKQQGELSHLLVCLVLLAVLVPAVTFDAPGPTKIILSITKGF